MTGYSYENSLIVFSLVVVFYVTFGGFRGVVLTDAMQGIVMFVGTADSSCRRCSLTGAASRRS